MSVKELSLVFKLIESIDTTPEYFKSPQKQTSPLIWKFTTEYGSSEHFISTEKAVEIIGTYKSTINQYLGMFSPSGIVICSYGWVFNTPAVPTSRQLCYLTAMAPIDCAMLHRSTNEHIFEFLQSIYSFSEKYQSTIYGITNNIINNLRALHSIGTKSCDDASVRVQIQSKSTQIVSPDNPKFFPRDCQICARIR